MRQSLSLLTKFCLSLLLFLAACTKETAELQKKPNLKLGEELSLAPLLNNDPKAKYINDAYIVVLNDDVADVDVESDRICKTANRKKEKSFKHAMKGFTVTLTAAELDQVRRDPRVKYVEQDQLVGIVATQTGATWGIDRVDQQSLPLSTTYTYNKDGASVDAYIFDTGIRLDHTQFGGRAITGFDAVTTGGTANDGNGHGTHVSGTVGGSTYGIAKAIRLIAVRVLDNNGSGTNSGVIAGLDWAVSHHTTKPAVGNMSLGGGASTALDDAVRRVIADGIIMCVAAGNSTANAANYSPARVTEAITVGATTSTDGIASYSNYGTTVDILAPGSSITSSWLTSTTATNTISGTSMATPHVAGAAALYLEYNPGSTQSQVEAGLKSAAVANKITGALNGSPNLLLQTNFGPVAPPTTPPPSPALSSPANAATNVALNASLSWTAASTATSYNVQVATDANFTALVINATNVAATSYALTGVTGGTVYYWRVSATNSIGTSAWSASNSFTTALPAPTLAAPANAATGISITPTLSWNAASGAASYRLQVSRNSNFSTLLINQSGIILTSQAISGLARNTRYYWRVSAIKGTLTSTSASRSFTTTP